MGALPVTDATFALLQRLAEVDLPDADARTSDARTRKDVRVLLTGFAEFYFERRMRSMQMLEGSLTT